MGVKFRLWNQCCILKRCQSLGSLHRQTFPLGCNAIEFVSVPAGAGGLAHWLRAPVARLIVKHATAPVRLVS